MAEENNIGSSRLLGTQSAQQAVDSLTTQVNRLAASVGQIASSMSQTAGAANRAFSGGTSGSNWNAGSNRNSYSSNGGSGGATYAGFGGMSGGRGNGGGGVFSGITGHTSRPNGGSSGGAFVPSTTSKGLAVAATGAGIAKALTNYGNKNMATNMQMDMFGNYSALAGGLGNGGYRQANNAAMRATFTNNFLALGANDAASAGYINAYTFGNAQFGGQANQSYVQGMRQAYGFGYTSPTFGAAGAATAAQQTYTARSLLMSQAMGLAAPILPGGVKNSMPNIARSFMTQTFGKAQISNRALDASLQQGGSLSVNMQYWGQQMGWNQQTIQEYENYLRGSNAAQNSGMTAAQYDKLTQQAATGSQSQRKSAVSQLTKATGLGASMFETQRNLDATRLTRQEDILESLAPAFDNATKMVDKFSQALTSFLKNTGLDKIIGTGAGWMSALSGGLSGLSSGFGVAAGAMGAMRLFSPTTTLTSTAARAASTAAGANGVYNITTLGTTAAATTAASGAGSVASKLAKAGPAAAVVLSMGHSGNGLLGDYMDRKKEHGISQSQMTELTMKWMQDKSAHKGWSNKKINKKFMSFSDEWKKGTLLSDPDLQKYLKPASDGQQGGASSASSGGAGGGSTKATGTNGGATAAQVIGFAEQQLGDPYVWGGTGPNGWDCSGLIQWAYAKAGVKIPRVASDQQKQGKAVPTDAVQPGDLLFNGSPAHHVVMAIGGGKIIEAPHTGANVRIRSFKPGEFTNARRILGAVGDMSSLTNGSGDNTDMLNDQASKVGGDIGGGYGGTSELEALMGALSGGTSGGPTTLSAASTSASSTSGTTGNLPKGTGSNTTSSLKAYAKKLLGSYGWSGQWGDFNALEMSEAGWNPKATNPSSGAYGLAQALPAGKYASAGSDWKTNGETQLRWMMSYIKDRYGDPAKAWSFHQRNNWYASGAYNVDQDQAAQIHQGEMILPAKQAESVRNAIANTLTTGVSTSGNAGITFESGAIVVQPTGPMTYQEAQTSGKMVVDAILADKRLKDLQKGN